MQLSSVLVRTKYICMYKQQNSDCIIVVILHTSQMFLYLHLKLKFHNKNMSDKNHASNFKPLSFLYLEHH